VRPASLGLFATIAVAVAVSSASASWADETAVASPRVASHTGRIERDNVAWHSSFVGNVGDDPSSSRIRIDLARPLHGQLDAARSPGVGAIVDRQGGIVAFAIDPQRVPGWASVVTVTVRTSLPREGDTVVLAPPIAAGDSVQRVELSGEGDLRFEPAPQDGFVRELGSWSAAGISESDRRAANAELGLGRRFGESPIYLKASAPVLERGIRGRALTAQERARPGLILAVLAFVVLIAACAAGYRALGRDAQIEEAEALLREEFEQHGG
jgi:hypothetical protein